MLTASTLLLLGVIVMSGALVQTLTGFGMNMVAVTLGALLLPIDLWLPVVVAINLPLTGWIAWRDRQHIQWTLLVRLVLPLMLLGGAVGYLIALMLDGDWLRRVLGVVVVGVTIRELAMLLGVLPPRVARRAEPWIGVAGVAQGMYATGGPFLAYAIGGMALPRLSYRATLMMVWLTMNSLLTVAFLLSGRFTVSTASQCLWMLPALALGMWMGDRLLTVIPERAFKLSVQCTLLAAGLSLALL